MPRLGIREQHMSIWRRKAIELFPQLRRDLNSKRYSIYQLYFDLLPMCRDAHTEGDTDLLARIYGFAEWCMSQSAKDLWNAAGVAFYEHIIDSDTRAIWPEVLEWLSDEVIRNVWVLWESRLSGDELEELRRLVATRRSRAAGKGSVRSRA